MDRKQRKDNGKYSFVNRPLKTETNYLQQCYKLSLVNLGFLETELGMQL